MVNMVNKAGSANEDKLMLFVPGCCKSVNAAVKTQGSRADRSIAQGKVQVQVGNKEMLGERAWTGFLMTAGALFNGQDSPLMNCIQQQHRKTEGTKYPGTVQSCPCIRMSEKARAPERQSDHQVGSESYDLPANPTCPNNALGQARREAGIM